MIVSEVWKPVSANPGIGGTTGREPAATRMSGAVSRRPSTSITFSLTKRAGKLVIEPERYAFAQTLADALELDSVTLIRCGGGSAIDAAREQWNDGTNTLAIAPGEVIAFSRNYVTNGILRDNGIVVHEISSAELSRGRGGPRCMSMPLWRE